MHDLVIDHAVVVDGLGGPPREGGVAVAGGLHGVWVNGVRTTDERGVRPECGRPGRVLRHFAA